MARCGDAPTNYNDAVGKLRGNRHGISCGFAEFGKCLFCCLDVAGAFPVGDFANDLGFQIARRFAGFLGIHAFDCPDCHAFFRYYPGLCLVGKAERFDARIVASV